MFPNTAKEGACLCVCESVSDGSPCHPLLFTLNCSHEHGAWLALQLVTIERSLPDPAQQRLSRQKDWDTVAPVPGKSAVLVLGGFTHAFALSLLCCLWWPHLLYNFLWVAEGNECRSWGNLEPPRTFGKLAWGCQVPFTRRPLLPVLFALLCNMQSLVFLEKMDVVK